MAARAHPTAIVDPRARLDEEVSVGPYAVVGAGAALGRGCVLHAHAMVVGDATLGPGNVVFPFAVIGGEPQSRRHAGGAVRVEIGAGNIFREHASVHGGTEDRPTIIGDDNLLMVGAHVAHDVRVGSHCVFANGVQLAGHAVIGDHATFGGVSGVTQRVQVGESAFVAATAVCERDVPPFVVVQGDRARVRALNVVGLRRRGVPEAHIRALRVAFRTLWLSRRTRCEALAELASSPDPYVRRLVAALASPSAVAPTR